MNPVKTIGHFVWWRINDVKMMRSAVQQELDNAGIKYKLPDVNLRSRFLKARQAVQQTGRKEGLMIRKISKAENEYVFGLVDEHVDTKHKGLSYAHNATMTFNPKTGALNCNAPHRAFDLVRDHYDQYVAYLDSDDIRTVVLDALNTMHKVSVRSRGGIYFLPVKFEEQLKQLQAFVTALRGDCDFIMVPQIDVEATKSAIYKALFEDLKTEIASFRQEIDEKSEKTGRKGVTVWKRRIEQFKELKTKIAFYSEALQFQGQFLADQLTDLEKEVQDKFLG